MLKNKRIAIALLVCLVLGVSSCKKYLNVNTNPNVAQSATVQTLLPAAQLYVGAALGVDLEIDGSFWAQYWTQNPNASQYIPLDRYSIGQDGFTYPWSNLYSAAENFYQMGKLADSLKKKQYKAISLLMEAYTFQLITDAWGDVPFTNALKGQFADGHIVNPTYDSQAVVYRGILGFIDSANKLIDNTDATKPGSDDLIYQGQMGQWQKFSNTLKLRVLLRMSQINPILAQDSIAALFNTAGTQFLGQGDDAQILYNSGSTNRNPLYGEEVGLNYTQNIVGSKSCIDSMNTNNDYRAYVFYEAAAASGTVAGITQGIVANNITPSSYSIPSYNVGADANNSASATAPVHFLTSYESYFLQAEAVARGWAVSSVSDSSLFYQGILASFRYYSTDLNNEVGVVGDTAYYYYVTGGGYWTAYPYTGTVAQKLRFIITQKYFAMCGNQGFEAWCELRRTGYPDWLPFPLNASPKSFPKRFLYPTSESTVNSSFPGLQPLQSKMWWDLY